MPLRDYREDYEDDFYGQGFGKKGVASVWLGLKDWRDEDVSDIDTLQDLCGVGYYDLSQQDANSFDMELVDLPRLFTNMSYASSYADEVTAAAHSKGIHKARYLVIQFDFAYDPAAAKRKIEDDPVFIGVFPYSKT